MSKQFPVITLDGPSGTGKGTMAHLLAQQLGWNLLDSGALYRVLALAAKQHGVDDQNEAALEVLAGHLDVQFKATEVEKPAEITLEGENVTEAIREEAIGNLASKIAVYPKVRQALLARQRAFREEPGLVTDGRDMGTVVFPDAQLKIFLVASPEERAKRRYHQLKGKGINVSLHQILTELVERDLRDRGRAVAPLKPATDAIIIDTTGYTINDVMERIMEEVEDKLVEMA